MTLRSKVLRLYRRKINVGNGQMSFMSEANTKDYYSKTSYGLILTKGKR